MRKHKARVKISKKLLSHKPTEEELLDTELILGFPPVKPKKNDPRRNARGVLACHDCGKEWPPMFVVHDPLWWQICGEDDKRIILCIHCAEKRLDRKITFADLDPRVGCTETLKLGAYIASNSR